jgi:uncharacterized protein (DUF983 family)
MGATNPAEDYYLPFVDEDLCPMCGGNLIFLGNLGYKSWYRCEACGMTSSH